VTWEERSATGFEIETPRPSLRAAIDGEPAVLRSPFELHIEPRALRVFVPPPE
jgi:diacylglycerol kinase family enzyme